MTTCTWISTAKAPPGRLTDDELLARVHELTRCERATTAELVAHLAELDARRLYLQEGCASLFAYCTRVLHLSEHAAFTRITAARLSRRLPDILGRLADGSVPLTTLRLLGPHLTRENHAALLDEARHRSKREVEEIVARVAPRPDVASRVRRLPLARVAPRGEGHASEPAWPEALALDLAAPGLSAGVAPRADEDARADMGAPSMAPACPAPIGVDSAARGASPAQPPHVAPLPAAPPPAAPRRPDRATTTPLSPGRYRVQFTADAATHAKLREAQDLLRREIPDGDVAAIVDRALDRLLEILRRRTAPRKRSARAAGRRARVGGRTPTGMDNGAGGRDAVGEAQAPRAVPTAPAEARAAAAAPTVGAAPTATTTPTAMATATATPASAATTTAPTPTSRATAPSRLPALPSRHIPAAVRRAVWVRDRGRCAFVGRGGRRCGARAFLEFHHVTPFAAGGGATAANLRLLCRAHNALESTRWFGARADDWREAARAALIVRNTHGCSAAAATARSPG